MNFEKYQSLMALDKAIEKGIVDTHGNQEVYVFEKIHGANYQIVTTEASQIVGRRKDFLGPEEDFYGDLSIRPTLLKMARDLFEHMKGATMAQELQARQYQEEILNVKGPSAQVEALRIYDELRPSVSPSFKELRIRGELYGGYYNHPDVAKVDHAARVGKGGVMYAQTTSFAVFQIEVDGKTLPFVETKALCMAAGLPTVPCVFKGTLEEAVKFSEENLSLRTLVPNGHPVVDKTGAWVLDKDGQPSCLPPINTNEREGHVIRFCQPEIMPDGREFIFKHVNPTHAEVQRKPKKSRTTIQSELPEGIRAVVEAVSPALTAERVRTLFSYEQFSRRDLKNAIGKVVSDAIGESREPGNLVDDFFDTAKKAERKRATSEISRIAFQTLTPIFLELCDE